VVPFLAGDEGEEPRAVFDSGIDVQDRLNPDDSDTTHPLTTQRLEQRHIWLAARNGL
jgi:hypothetical protein